MSSLSREEAGERPMRFSNTDVGGIVLLPGQRTSQSFPLSVLENVMQ
jgi:hypothetical protein